ncbi:MAG: response regulator [Phycisphaerae bacterium]|nr:response regulator [Saprospiraceae bacterium]
MLKFIRLVFLICCCLAEVQAQNYLPVARHFGIEDGLPHRQVNCIIEDRQGFIWVATNGGVARFDGLRFKIFNKADNGLTTDIINWMLEDANGNLWLISAAKGFVFSTISSIDILNPVSGQITPFDQYIQQKPPVPFENLHLFGLRLPSTYKASHPAKPGTLFFGTRAPGGWVSWHPETGWKHLALSSMPYLSIRALTPQGGVLCLTNNGSPQEILVETDTYGNVLRTHQGDPGNYFSLMYSGSQNGGAHFVVEENKARINPIIWAIKPGEDKKRLALQLPNNHPTLEEWGLLFGLEKEGLWISEFGVFNQKGEVLLNLRAQFPKFNNRPLTYSLRDRNGGIWFSTSFGLEQIEIRKDHFRRFLFDENALNARGTSCRGILQQGGNLWINTEGPEPSRRGIELSTGRVFFEQKAGSAFGLASDGMGHLWSGQTFYTNMGMSLAQGDSATGKDMRIFPFKTPVPWFIFPVNASQFWIGTETGFVFLNPLTGQYSQPDIRLFPELEKASIVHIGRDSDKNRNTIWVCSSTGFYKMNVEGQIIERFWSGGKGDSWLPYDDFYHFYEDKEGVFWLGTAGGGLLRWNPRSPSGVGGGEKQLFSRKNGLLNGFVYAVYEDDFGHLWLPTDYGIAQFDKKSQVVRRTWLPSDGLAQYEFNRTSHHRGEDGTLYFGGLNGVTAFHPKDFYESNAQLRSEAEEATESQARSKKLVLTDFKLYSASSEKLENRTADLIASGRTDGTFPAVDGIITMQPADRYFQLEFALLDYFSPEKVTYSYKIEGVDADWNLLNEPLLRLSSLPFGTHRLKILAQSADGIWAENELNFVLKVLPPFYLRWWFLFLAICVIAGSAYYAYRFQLRRRLAEKETQRLQELDAFKTRFFTNISHEFRTPLTVILGMVENLKKYFIQSAKPEFNQAAELVRRNSLQVLNLVNQLLELSRLESGNLDISNVNGDLVAFLRYQVESFHSYAETRQIHIHFESDVPALQMAFDQGKIQTILVNLFSNALKFTPKEGSIHVRCMIFDARAEGHERAIANSSAQIVIQITDTGCGIPANELDRVFDRFHQVDNPLTSKGEGTGIGLALVQELVKFMHGTVTVESTVGLGTSIKVSLPYTPPQPALESFALEPIIWEVPMLRESSDPDNDDEDDTRPLLLIVEDNPDVRFYIAACVKTEYRVCSAENGAAGIKKAQERIPDIIISDVMMPEKDGFELCETLKNDELTSHIPIVLLTARADFESRIAGLKRGADDYLAKPFDPAELKVRLNNLIQLRRRLQQRYSGILTSEGFETLPTFEIEDAFLQKIRAIVEAHMTKSDFEMPELARALGMSRSQIFRKVKALTDASPSILIRSIRLQKAKELLQDSRLSIAEVAYNVGFSAPTYFAKTFFEEFGKTPSEWRQS